MCVAQAMERNALDAGFSHHLDDARPNAIRTVGTAVGPAEHQPVVLVVVAEQFFVPFLNGLVLAKGI